MVTVAQLVRAPGCDPGGRGFESPRSPFLVLNSFNRFDVSRALHFVYDIAMAKPELLECFDNPNPKRAYTIEHVAEEFTSVCPKTGHPDFGTVTLIYGPAAKCVELKSLKLYLQAFRNEGIFYEAVTNRIADDLAEAMEPTWMVLETNWKGRGGINSTITVAFGDVP